MFLFNSCLLGKFRFFGIGTFLSWISPFGRRSGFLSRSLKAASWSDVSCFYEKLVIWSQPGVFLFRAFAMTFAIWLLLICSISMNGSFWVLFSSLLIRSPSLCIELEFFPEFLILVYLRVLGLCSWWIFQVRVNKLCIYVKYLIFFFQISKFSASNFLLL